VRLRRSWFAASFVVAVFAPSATATPGADQPRTVAVIERKLASALEGAQTTLILRVNKHRTNTAGYVTAVEWVDLGDGQRHIVWRDSAGRVTGDTSRLRCDQLPFDQRCTMPPIPSAACGCDLDPFTNFPGPTPQVALLGQETIDRQAAFHLRFTVTAWPYASTTDFWIDRSTYLPVHAKLVVPKTSVKGSRAYTVTNDFAWLPRTSGNLAQLAGG
jgi:hypothetical protein